MLQIPSSPDKQVERQPRETRHAIADDGRSTGHLGPSFPERWDPWDATAPVGFLPCPLHGAGLRLVHYAHQATAAPHDTLTYSAWIINDSGEELTNVALILRSFTNAGMEELRYTSGPSVLSFGPMPAGGEAELVFTYVVTDSDQRHAGELISAMAVQAVTASRTKLWDEHDAITPISLPE
ncbi:hypothetical protein [Arthrobacter sp. AZCC_0090]|uniref:hypothetical protein n=1 Tax=Arthrobacter sp. AZCC_0090 TaxID=2735881 RepID=UPI00160F7E16|nr:hypothetical protein [Arthrobacter sp. AZCC_0090]MBB6405959.1 hypothetical protein [Arthrobacter sp. AZCC_0090]